MNDMPHQDKGSTPLRDLTIGEFSRLAQLSPRMLRHYDDRGVLSPTWVDRVSGYRYYLASQLRDAHRIVALRDIGFSVAAIAALLPAFDNPAVLEHALRAQREQLVGEANTVAQQIGEVDHLIAQLQEKAMSTPDITRITFPAHTVAYLRDIIATYGHEGELWPRFMAAFQESGAVFAPSMRGGATFHDDGYRETDPDTEVWMDIAAMFSPDKTELPGGGSYGCRVVPAQDTLMGTLHGDYSGVAAISEELGRELSKQGLAFAGPMFNVYVVGPESESDPSKWVTEIYLPVKDAS